MPPPSLAVWAHRLNFLTPLSRSVNWGVLGPTCHIWRHFQIFQGPELPPATPAGQC